MVSFPDGVNFQSFSFPIRWTIYICFNVAAVPDEAVDIYDAGYKL